MILGKYYNITGTPCKRQTAEFCILWNPKRDREPEPHSLSSSGIPMNLWKNPEIHLS